MTDTDLRTQVAPLGTYAVDQVLTGGLAPGERLADIEFDGCTFEGSVVAQAAVVGCIFTETRFVRCDLTLTDLTDSRFVGCTFESCRLVGLNWSVTARGLVLEPMTLIDCRLDDALFVGADLSGWHFQRCRLQGAEFTEANLRGARFEDCDLTRASLIRTDLRQANLVGSTGWVLNPRDARVEGLIIDEPGAAGVLQPLGIRVQ